MKIIIDVSNQVKATGIDKNEWLKSELSLFRTLAHNRGTRVKNLELVGDVDYNTFLYMIFDIEINETFLRSKNKRLYIPCLEWLYDLDYSDVEKCFDSEFFESFCIKYSSDHEKDLAKRIDPTFYLNTILHQPVPIY